MRFLLTVLIFYGHIAYAEDNLAILQKTGAVLAVALCDLKDGEITPYAEACGYQGKSRVNLYISAHGMDKIRTFTSCKIWTDLGESLKKAMLNDDGFKVTATGISRLNRLVDEVCADPKTAASINDDNGKTLEALVAKALLSPLGPVIGSVMAVNGIAHEVTPERLQEQLNDWLTTPVDSFKRSDIGRSDVGKVVCGIFGC